MKFGGKMDENNQVKHTVLPWIILSILAIIIVFGGIYFLLGATKQDKSSSALNTTDQPTKSADKGKDPNEYKWSTMDQGPYKDKVSYATGTTLTSWVDSKKIIAEHASVPDVINNNGVLHVYFVDVTVDDKPEQIGHIQSADGGATWGERSIVAIKGLGEKVAVDPCPFVLPDGRTRLYYLDINATRSGSLSNNAIYSAISDDGLNFTEEDGVRFKYRGIFDPDVINVNDDWRMYVGTDDQKVLSATSIDGLNFTYEGVAFTGGAIPNVVYENDLYYLFTGGIEISSSADGKNFTRTGNRFDSGALTADPGVAKFTDDKYIMVYKTSDVMPQKQ
jgi:hypothetical protein